RFFHASVRATFDRAVRESRPDVVLATWAYPDGWAAVRLARSHGLPVVVMVNGSDVRRMDEVPARSRGTREALCAADGVIAVSADLAARVVALGADPDRALTVLDGVDRTLFNPRDRTQARRALGLADDERHLLFIGNLLPVKGVDVLLQACATLAAQRTDWRLHLVGDGPERARLAAQAQALGIDARVVFHGSRAHAELPEWLRASDLFVLPSRSEGIPNVLLEASACATPWVASDVGGIPEIVSLGAGTLVPPEQPVALADALARGLDAPPPIPANGPRDRREAVAEIARFLERSAAHAPAPQPLPRFATVGRSVRRVLTARAPPPRPTASTPPVPDTSAHPRLKILCLHKQILFPRDTGGKIRALNLLKHLARWHDVTYVCNLRRGEEALLPQMHALGMKIEAVPGEASPHGGLRFY